MKDNWIWIDKYQGHQNYLFSFLYFLVIFIILIQFYICCTHLFTVKIYLPKFKVNNSIANEVWNKYKNISLYFFRLIKCYISINNINFNLPLRSTVVDNNVWKIRTRVKDMFQRGPIITDFDSWIGCNSRNNLILF